MNNFWVHLQNLTDAQSIISLGFYALVIIVFAETGLFFGFFLPGDYLLFMSGLLCSSGKFYVSIYVLILSFIAAGILGNFAGYWFGYRTGNQLLTKHNSMFFKRRHIQLAKDFYGKYGGMALVLGRFFPIIRTFAPIFAGIVKLNFKKFTVYNCFGCIAWVCTFTLSGFFLGKRFPQLANYMDYIILGLIITTAVPLIIFYFRERVRTSENIE
jgi:membrane-associated protein